MPSPERRSRVDSYGKPLAELAAAHRAVRLEEPVNVAQISLMHALVEDTCRAALRRGWYGTVQLRFRVEDGMIQADVYSSLERNWKNQPEP